MKKLSYLLMILAFTWACKSNSSHDHNDHKGHDHRTHDHQQQEEQKGGIVLKAGEITLSEAISLPFSEAVLKLKSPSDGAILESGKVGFDFDVENYELGSQTTHKNAEHCANSAKGQHIHLILNNSPYTAHYEADFESELKDGQYIGLAFLSRSYHESIKSPTAYQLFDFSVGTGEANGLNFDATQPHMFFSRPKGTYKGKDAKKVMLDFYLTNVDLSSNGYKVRAQINDETIELSKWVPYLMEGLPMGENTIKLTLLDAEGNTVESPFNPVTRTITLTEE